MSIYTYVEDYCEGKARDVMAVIGIFQGLGNVDRECTSMPREALHRPLGTIANDTRLYAVAYGRRPGP
jgi:hypothetical protein